MKFNLQTVKQEQYLIPLKIVAVYVVWKCFYHFASMPGTALNHYWAAFVWKIGTSYASVVAPILTLAGLKARSHGIYIELVQSQRLVIVQEHCLAIPAMVILAGSVIFFKGSSADKVKFLLLGWMGIILINLLRLIMVAFAFVYMSEHFFIFHHSVVYVVLTYGFIFLMIRWWMNNTLKEAS